jgi:hypothetical protein
MSLMKDHKNRQILLLILLGLFIGSIFLLAGGLSGLQFQPGKPLHLLDWLLAQLESNLADFSILNTEIGEDPSSSDLWSGLGEGTRTIIVIVFWLMLVFSIVYAVISPRFRNELVRMFIFILTLVLILPYIARRLVQRPQSGEEVGMSGDLPFGEPVLPEPPPFVQQPPGWFLMLVDVILLTLLFWGIYIVWRRLRPKSDAQAVVVKNVRRALSDLESGSEFKDAVIACYSKMCRELQKTQGIFRHRAMTPREFESHLSRAGITSSHIQQLTLLFEGARYGAEPTDPVKEQTAKQCLQVILQAYGD